MNTWTPPNSECPPPKPGEPLLHAAARTGDHTAIRSLVAEGEDINAVFDIGLDPDSHEQPATPLMVAAGSGEGATIDTVQLLLELGADPVKAIGRNSAATMACTGLGWNYKPGGDADRLRLVLEKGAPFPPKPYDLNRMLCDTARIGDCERLQILLQYGLSASGHWNPEEAKENHRQIMDQMSAFREAEPDIFDDIPGQMQDVMSESMEDIYLQLFEQVPSAPSNFEIPLFCAAESGNSDCVNMLLEAGAAFQARDSSQRTAMYYAASDSVVRTLIESGLPLEDRDVYGWSPLVSALCDGEGGKPIVKTLIANGADVNATHDRGYTVFMSAVGSMGRDVSVMRALVEAGADPHAITEMGYNAFHAAIDVDGEAGKENSVRSTLEYLKELGIDIEHRNNAGQTPLARAIDEGTGTEVCVLCELGANPNTICSMRQCDEDTCGAIDMPVLFAAANGTGIDKQKKIDALLTSGADPLVTNADGITPMAGIVAALCSVADDYTAVYKRFFAEFSELRLTENSMPRDRLTFLENAIPILDDFISRFAAKIPVKNTCGFDTEWYEERLKCLVLLAAHEGWARWRHR